MSVCAHVHASARMCGYADNQQMSPGICTLWYVLRLPCVLDLISGINWTSGVTSIGSYLISFMIV